MLNFKNLKTKLFLSPVTSYVVILLALVFAGALSFIFSKTVTPAKTQEVDAKKVNVVKKPNISSTPVPENEIQYEEKTTTPGVTENKVSYTLITTPGTVETSVSTNTSTVTSNPTPTLNITAESKVNVTLNGTNFEVKINDNSNQCDVLSKALEQGKIQSLNMRYDNSLGSYGVYQINGVGKENSVWWTYKVNGQSPSKGCSYVKANSGDSIEWKYIGS